MSKINALCKEHKELICVVLSIVIVSIFFFYYHDVPKMVVAVTFSAIICAAIFAMAIGTLKARNIVLLLSRFIVVAIAIYLIHESLSDVANVRYSIGLFVALVLYLELLFNFTKISTYIKEIRFGKLVIKLKSTLDAEIAKLSDLLDGYTQKSMPQEVLDSVKELRQKIGDISKKLGEKDD